MKSKNKINIDIEKNLKIFKDGDAIKNKGMDPNERYASFDYCFNYFQTFKENNKIEELASKNNLQQSCLQLGFYLASWGMLRGSSFLLEKSVRYYATLIKGIVGFDKKIWDIDADSYSDENIELLLLCKNMILEALGGKEKDPSDILTTKIMLGVFGNIPAFDSYFKKGFRVHYCKENQLKKIAEFYKDNKGIINMHSKRIHTFDFLSGKETKRKYTKAKIIDMIGFIEGQNIG